MRSNDLYPMFDNNGFFNGEIPDQCVIDCTRPGQDATDAIVHWIGVLEFEVPREAAQAYLREFGAWDDLKDASDATLTQRVLWVACGDIRENGGWDGLIH